MSKFKVGQRVKALSSWMATYGWIEKGKVYTVTATEALSPSGTSWALELDGKIYTDFVEGFELATPTLDSLSVGDVVLSSYSNEMTVLAVLGSLIGLSYGSGPDNFYDWFTIAQLKSDGYTVKGEEDEVKELTMDEVAKLAGVAVDKLRIKKEAE